MRSLVQPCAAEVEDITKSAPPTIDLMGRQLLADQYPRLLDLD